MTKKTKRPRVLSKLVYKHGQYVRVAAVSAIALAKITSELNPSPFWK